MTNITSYSYAGGSAKVGGVDSVEWGREESRSGGRGGEDGEGGL